MRCLIRKISRKKSGQTIREQPWEGDRLTIGKGTDQDLFLSGPQVAYHHAAIEQTAPGRFAIVSGAPTGISVNGKASYERPLEAGDEITIDRFVINIAESNEFDLAIDVEERAIPKVGELAQALRSRSIFDIERTGMSRRKWSWLAFVLIVVLFLALPVAGHFFGSVENMLRLTRLPDDSIWMAGNLANAHQAVGDECNVCHVVAFEPVQDSSCLDCHTGVARHADERFTFAPLTSIRCAKCHREHAGDNTIVRRDEPLCTACHARLSQRVAKEMGAGVATDLPDIASFPEAHAEFRATLAQQVDGETKSMRVLLSESPGEQSNLRFPHDVHLTGLSESSASTFTALSTNDCGIETPSTDDLLCDSCHVVESGGELMKPVSYEAHCAQCHRLDFEATDCAAAVEHGLAWPALVRSLEQYYAYRALEGGVADAGAPEIVQKRRLPGQQLSETQRQAALDWARERSSAVAEKLVRHTRCGGCHLFEEPDPAATNRAWKIAEVQVTAHWFPKAHFNHARHVPYSCDTCHQDVAQATSSERVLIPGIAVCAECHGDADSTTKVASTCVSCHQFHGSDQPMSDSGRR